MGAVGVTVTQKTKKERARRATKKEKGREKEKIRKASKEEERAKAKAHAAFCRATAALEVRYKAADEAWEDELWKVTKGFPLLLCGRRPALSHSDFIQAHMAASEAAPPVTCRALVLAARLAAAALQLDHAGAYSRDHTPTAVLWDQASCPPLCFAVVAAAVGAVGEAGTWDRWDALEEASRCSEPVPLWCARGGALWG